MTNTPHSAEGPQVLDMEVVEDARSAMKDKFVVMVQYYLEDAASFIQQIEAALIENDVKKIASPAHTLKSSSAQLGAAQVAEIAQELEETARQVASGQGGGDIASLVQRLRAALDAVEPKFKEILEQQAA